MYFGIFFNHCDKIEVDSSNVYCFSILFVLRYVSKYTINCFVCHSKSLSTFYSTDILSSSKLRSLFNRITSKLCFPLLSPLQFYSCYSLIICFFSLTENIFQLSLVLFTSQPSIQYIPYTNQSHFYLSLFSFK